MNAVFCTSTVTLGLWAIACLSNVWLAHRLCRLYRKLEDRECFFRDVEAAAEALLSYRSSTRLLKAASMREGEEKETTTQD